jgi:hypothetical protein
MSQQVDANLVELARKWLGKMMPYRRVDLALSSLGVCITALTFLRFLLSYGCELIGLSEDEDLYLRCGNKLTKLNIYDIISHCYSATMDVIDKIPILSGDEEYKLVDMRPYGSVRFIGTGIFLSIFEDEPVYLGVLDGTPLYLKGVEIYSSYTGNRQYAIEIILSTISKQGGMEPVVGVEYALEENNVVRTIVSASETYVTWEWETEKGNQLLAMLNEKSHIIDNLLGEATNIFVEGFRAIIVAMLY